MRLLKCISCIKKLKNECNNEDDKYCLIIKIICWLFPFFELYNKLKIINTMIEDEELNKTGSQNTHKYDKNIEEKVLIDSLKETIDIKNSIEDKIKSSLIAISIASTLIFSFSKFIQDISNPTKILMVLLFLGLFSFAYMILAAVLSIYCIVDVSKISRMEPMDYLLHEQVRKEQIAQSIEYNILLNRKRNGFMAASYYCIRNSIILFIFIFILSFLTSLQGYSRKDELKNVNNEIVNINAKLSTISIKSNADSQNIVNLQQSILKTVNDNKILENKLNSIYLLVKDINKVTAKNPNIIPEEMKNLLLDLDKRTN